MVTCYEDSMNSALKEIQHFFPKFNYEKWLVTEEPLLRSGKCKIDHNLFTHIILGSRS